MELKKLSVSNLVPWNWFKDEDRRVPQVQQSDGPADPLARMHQEMDRLFDQTFRAAGMPSLFDRRLGMESSSEVLLRPSVDITEHENSYEITVEVPGIQEKDVKLSLENQSLVISGEKRSEHESRDEGKVHFVERSYGHFQRVLALPEDARAEDAKAKFRDGVLKITLPRDKSHHVDRRHIEIESDG